MPKKSRRFTTPDYNFIPDDILPYSSLEILNILCSADDILDRMRYDNNILFKNMRNEIFSITEVLSVDELCMCKMGWGIRPYVNKYFCIPCELMRRLSSTIKVPEDRILKIEVGKYEGRRIHITSFLDTYSPYYNDDIYQGIFTTMINKQNILELCDNSFIDFHKKTKLYLTNSYMTNYIMNCIFITNKMMKYKMPNFPDYVWSYYCDKEVKILRNTTVGFNEILNNENFQVKNKLATAHTNLNPLKIEVVKSILLQLVSTLHFLCKYAYIHGKANISELRFTIKNVSYKYDGINISAPFILHIQPTINSSLSFESDKGTIFRLGYNPNVIPTDKLDFPINNREVIINFYKTDKTSKDDIPMLPQIADKMTYCYKVGEHNVSSFVNLTNNYSIPLMHSTFEFYCFIISLMCEDSFYVSFIEDIQMQRIWYNLWFAPEYENMMQNLAQLKTNIKVEHQDIINMVSRYTLRTDAIKFFWEFLKMD